MADQVKLMKRMMGEKSTDEVLHSSGLARGGGWGSTTGTYADQQVEERRKFVRGYENSQIMRSAKLAERARQYVPRAAGGSGGLHGGSGLAGAGAFRGGRDTSGDGISGSLIGRPLRPGLPQ